MVILCINLDSRPDRWEQVSAEFARVGLHVERVAAVSGDNRPLAFNQSVYKAMGMAKTWAYDEYDVPESLLLFEDDVMFDGNPKLPAYTPTDFLTLHLGCNIIGTDQTIWKMPTAYSDNLALLHNAWQSHATLYSAECVQYILDNFNPNVLDADNMIFDEWLRTHVLNQGRSYVMKPMIAYQRPSYSDIWNMQADYTGAHRAGNEYLKKL